MTLEKHDASPSLDTQEYVRLYTTANDPMVMVSSGNFKASGSGIAEITETLVFGFSDTVAISKPSAVVTITQLGDAYDGLGSPLASPSFTYDPSTLTIRASEKVFAVVSVTYSSAYSLYLVTLPNLTDDIVMAAMSVIELTSTTLTLAAKAPSVDKVAEATRVPIEVVSTGWVYDSAAAIAQAYAEVLVYTDTSPSLDLVAGSKTSGNLNPEYLTRDTDVPRSSVLQYSNSFSVPVAEPVTSISSSFDYVLVGEISTPQGTINGLSHYIQSGYSSVRVGVWVGTNGDSRYDRTISVSPDDQIIFVNGKSYALPVTATIMYSYETTRYRYKLYFDMLTTPIPPMGLGVTDNFRGRAGVLTLNPPSNSENS